MINFIKDHTDPTIVVSVLVALLIAGAVWFVIEVLWDVYQRTRL